MASIITHASEPLDLIVWRNLGSTAGLVEQTLELNRDLADHGALLPAGLTITLPDAPRAAPVMETVKLWG